MSTANAKMAEVRPDAVALGGGLDVVSPPLFSKPGTARLAYNYEPATGGGFERSGGIERHDGRPAPHDAEFIYIEVDTAFPSPLGSAVEGATSGATGRLLYVATVDSQHFIALGRVSGTFVEGEDLEVSASPVAAIESLDPTIDGFLDNQLAALAATDRRLDITAVPGSGDVRGLEVLADVVYAWRNNVGGTALVMHKATSGGWVAISLFYELSFTVGSTEPAEGATITQGSASATLKRVVKESGDWGASTAAGRYIITIPTGGTFSGGALAGPSGAGTVPAAGTGVYHGTQIALLPNGRVRTDIGTFIGSASSNRIYGCDGINREFEFAADEVLAPLVTGMTVRASAVRIHRNHLFFAYGSSVQHSGIGDPYVHTVRSGASELGTGDTVTDLLSISGSETSAALMILCRNSIHVMYGDSSADWTVKVLSRLSGSSAGSAQDIAGVVALDAPGFSRYPATQAFGNYRWDQVSQQIEPIARGQECSASVWVADRSKYRVFFTDGTAVCGMPKGRGQFDWTTIDYGRTIVCAVNREIGGVSRTFVADTSGFVYECDVGRSFDGDSIEYALRLNELNQKSPGYIKTYKRVEIEAQADSAFTLNVSGEFFDGDDEIDGTETISVPTPGAGFRWDLANWDEAYWDVAGVARKRVPLEGQGTSVAITFAGESDNELPHTLRAVTTSFILRRQAR